MTYRVAMYYSIDAFRTGISATDPDKEHIINVLYVGGAYLVVILVL